MFSQTVFNMSGTRSRPGNSFLRQTPEEWSSAGFSPRLRPGNNRGISTGALPPDIPRVPGNTVENRFRILLEYRQFIQRCRIKHHIGFFLEREDIPLFPLLTESHILIVSCAEEPLVLESLIILLISLPSVVGIRLCSSIFQLGQGADVDFEFALLRRRIGKLIVETVDSFNDKDILLSQLQVISLIFSLTAYKNCILEAVPSSRQAEPSYPSLNCFVSIHSNAS